MFWAVGFAICFGTGNSIIGTSGWGLDVADKDIGTVFASLSFSDVPLAAKYLFEVVFCGVSLAIVWGGMAERTKFSTYIIFGVIFSAVIYPVVGHWIWGGGWLSTLGMQDFAGSTVVHLQGAVRLLRALSFSDPGSENTPRWKSNAIVGHNIPFVVLGTFILWLGWFGSTQVHIDGDDSFCRLLCLHRHDNKPCGGGRSSCGHVYSLEDFRCP
ncbi:ammonium transporter [mine drainage metagenome]|uniref:Ammonium transporter n=1 Tax=mine drainage metagenome TaxID=410659 RepID=T1BVN0_9ZZZZ